MSRSPTPPTSRSASPGPTTPTAIAAVQARAWRTSYAGLVPAAALPTDPAATSPSVAATRCAAPRDARHRVLVALERNRVVGFALTTPGHDPDCDPVADGELLELTVDPAERGKGHGSRLLQAVVDTLVADRFTRAVTWLLADDDAQRALPHRGRLGRDGAHRELDLDGSGRHRQAGAPAHRHRVIHPAGVLAFRGAAGHHGGPPAPSARRRSRRGCRDVRSVAHAPSSRHRPRLARRLDRTGACGRALVAHVPVSVGAGVALGALAGVVDGVRPAPRLPPRPAAVHGTRAPPRPLSGLPRLAPCPTRPCRLEQRRTIVAEGLAVGVATGAYGVSFGAVSVAAGLSCRRPAPCRC